MGVGGGQAAITQGHGGVQPPGTGVRPTPVTKTPHFPATTTPVEQVRQLVQCGGTMYAVGRFSTIISGQKTYTRHNAFSFKASSPYTVTPWAPKVNGEVNSIAFRRGKCSDAYIGGSFSAIGHTRAHNIAEITTGNGTVVTRFGHDASATVETLLMLRDRILVGGFYRSINGSSANPYMTALNLASGKDDGFVHLHIRGHYSFPHVAPNRTRVFNQSLSHSGKLDMVVGDFTSVGGLKRQQIFMLKVSGSAARVTSWTSRLFARHCITLEPEYVEAASWSPNDKDLYIATTGSHAYQQPTKGTSRRTGLCDAATKFPAAQKTVKPIWINYTGCDSLYSTAVDKGTAYFAGHERWSMNPRGCNDEGPGAYYAPGMEGVSPKTGALYLNARGTRGYYERARGYGADDMLLTHAGLWIASDNFSDAQMCGGVANLAGICFLPY